MQGVPVFYHNYLTDSSILPDSAGQLQGRGSFIGWLGGGGGDQVQRNHYDPRTDGPTRARQRGGHHRRHGLPEQDRRQDRRERRTRHVGRHYISSLPPEGRVEDAHRPGPLEPRHEPPRGQKARLGPPDSSSNSSKPHPDRLCTCPATAEAAPQSPARTNSAPPTAKQRPATRPPEEAATSRRSTTANPAERTRAPATAAIACHRAGPPARPQANAAPQATTKPPTGYSATTKTRPPPARAARTAPARLRSGGCGSGTASFARAPWSTAPPISLHVRRRPLHVRKSARVPPAFGRGRHAPKYGGGPPHRRPLPGQAPSRRNRANRELCIADQRFISGSKETARDHASAVPRTARRRSTPTDPRER